VINPDKRTECVGAEDEPQCRLVCPTEPGRIVQNPDHVETKEELLGKYQKCIPDEFMTTGKWG
jgi:hypothetical protein